MGRSDFAVTARRETRLRQTERHAEGYLELGMPQAALDVLAQAGSPTDLSAYGCYLQGEAFRALQRYGEAVAPLRKAAASEPDSIHVWLALGWCYKRSGRLDLAIAAIRQALAVEPAEALLHYNLACYLSLSGQKRPALEHLSRAFVLDPDYRRMVDSEPDFDPIRSDPQFQALTGTTA